MSVVTRGRRTASHALRSMVIIASALAALSAPPASAATSPAVPVQGSIVVGVGAGGVQLGMSKASVTAVWGPASRCVAGSGREACYYRSSDGVDRALAVFTSGRISLISIPFANLTWTTARGIHVGSTASTSLDDSRPGALELAYGPLLDPALSTYYSRAMRGTDAQGYPSITRFTVGWWAEYTPGQYFGVTAITIYRG